MLIVQGGRRIGLTHFAAQELADNPDSLVLVHNAPARTMILDELRKIGADHLRLAPRIVTVSDVRRDGLRGVRYSRLIVDDLDDVLLAFVAVPSTGQGEHIATTHALVQTIQL